MKLNVSKRTVPTFTHEGGRASHTNPEESLRRSVMSCLLWEDTFYEDGVSIADRIIEGVLRVRPQVVVELAIEARTKMNLRHVPLLLCRTLAANRGLKAETLERVIQRPDELAEFLALYWADGKQPLSAQVKKGLARAFRKFDAYALAKYNRDAAVKLRDVLFLSHARPRDAAQAETWKLLIDGKLPAPDTWEVALSGGADKGATFTRLIQEGKLGALALLRNLRNMENANVDRGVVREALHSADVRRVLPFRFIAAARHAPVYEQDLEALLFKSLEGTARLKGRTVLLVDVSGSMEGGLSGKSDMTRMDAACGVAMIARELCEDVEVHTFSERGVVIPSRRGFALRDAIVNSQPHGGTLLAGAIAAINARRLHDPYNRIIVVTDEQSHDGAHAPLPKSKAYILNVGSYQNGVGYGRWTHINGFSEACVRYIQALEALPD